MLALTMGLHCTCDNGVPLVVEGTAEHLVCVAFQNLSALSSLCVPQPGSFIRAGRQDTCSLRVETNLEQENKDFHSKVWHVML